MEHRQSITGGNADKNWVDVSTQKVRVSEWEVGSEGKTPDGEQVSRRNAETTNRLNKDDTKYRGESVRCECTLASIMKWKCKISDK